MHASDILPRHSSDADHDESVATLRFTEEMKGYASFSEDTAPWDLMFHLDITVPDVTQFVADPNHTATADGFIRCAALGGDCPVVLGTVNLLFDVMGPSYKRMRYHLHFVTPAGEAFTLSGVKQVRDDPGCDLWSDTSTLYTEILRGHVTEQEALEAPPLAHGVLHIYLRDFLKQLSTFRVDAPTLEERAAALGRFGTYFLGSLWHIYVANKAA